VTPNDLSGAPAAELAIVDKTPSTMRRAVKRYLHMAAPMVAAMYIVLLVILAVFGSKIATHDPAQTSSDLFASPSGDHWFGTDDLGRDLFSRLVVGTRVSVRSGLQVTLLALAIALPLGLLTGYVGGMFDLVMLRIMDAIISFPGLVLVLAVVAVLGPGLNNAMLAITVAIVPGFVRLIRAQTLSLREQTYVEASQSIGTPTSTILRKRILPGVLSPLIVAATILLGTAMLIEAGLSFLGFGEQAPNPSWGNMLQRGFNYLFTEPWQTTLPGLAIAMAVLSFNMAGDGLRDALGLVEQHNTKGVKRGRMGLTSVDSVSAQLTPRGSDVLLSVRDLSVEFATADGPVTVVDKVSFDLRSGEIMGLVGESGCGKSVTSSAIMRLISSPPGRITSGEVWFAGRDLLAMPFGEMRAIRGRQMSMVFQDPMSSLDPAFTIGNQMIEVVRLHQDVSKAEARRLALDLLQKVHIPDAEAQLDAYPHNLSGGMRQRVLIATALINRPKLLIADEPTTALDVTVQAQILELIKELQAELDMGVIFVTHDLGVVADLCDRVQVMYAGEIIEQGHIDDTFANPRHPYTNALLKAIPQTSGGGDRLRSIPGVVPPPSLWPTGCHFSTRCAHVVPACRDEPVELTTLGQQTVRCIRHNEVAELEAAVDSEVMVPTPRRARHANGELARVSGATKWFPIKRGVLKRTVGQIRAVDGVDLALTRGSTVGLVGESGSGKSTLGRTLLQLIEPTAGTIEFEGTNMTDLSTGELRRARRDMQMIFQDPYASMDPRAYVGDSVGEPLQTQLRLKGEALDRRVSALFEMVGLSATYRGRFPHEFSGGQLQRLAIARALATDPKLIVCDEAVSSLDVSTRAEVINLLADLQDQLDLTYLFISHDLSVVRHVSDRIAVMYLGRIVEEGDAETVYTDPKHPYSRALLSAIPVPDPPVQRIRERIVLEGDLPSPAAPPPGCHFHTRCPEVMDICRTVDPPQIITPDGVRVACHLHHGPKARSGWPESDEPRPISETSSS
jgi:oligopeptide/dipeptide ABC transporter ATP-binding protein